MGEDIRAILATLDDKEWTIQPEARKEIQRLNNHIIRLCDELVIERTKARTEAKKAVGRWNEINRLQAELAKLKRKPKPKPAPKTPVKQSWFDKVRSTSVDILD